MAGYTRSYSKTTGQTILAGDFNAEFQLIDDAFDNSTGHKHDGSTDEGLYVPLISDTDNYNSIELDTSNNEIDFNVEVASSKARQMVLKDGYLLPNATNDLSIGDSTYLIKDFWLYDNFNLDNGAGGLSSMIFKEGGSLRGYVQMNHASTPTMLLRVLNSGGGVNASYLQMDQNGVVALVGDTSVTLGDSGGNVFIAIDTTQIITKGAILPTTDDSYDLGSASLQWKDLYIDGTANIDTGSIDALTANTTFTCSGSVTSDLTPDAATSRDLGSATYPWYLCYLDWIYTENLTIQGNSPSLEINDENGAIDEKKWSWSFSGNNIQLSSQNDAGSAAVGVVSIQRDTHDNLGPYYFNTGNGNTTLTMARDGTCAFGTSTPLGADLGSLTVSTGGSGVSSINSGYDDLILDSSGNTGMTICQDGTGLAGIAFADTASQLAGLLYFSYTSNYFEFYANGKTAFTIAASSLNTVACGANFDFTIPSGDFNLAAPTVPGSASATGAAGDISWDSSYIYVCTATNTWKRAALSTW